MKTDNTLKEHIDDLCKELDAADTIGKAHTVAIKAIRNWQAARAEHKHTEAELVEIVAELQANGWEYGAHPTTKAGIVIRALIEAGALQVKE